jgi:hypothetical protein
MPDWQLSPTKAWGMNYGFSPLVDADSNPIGTPPADPLATNPA